MSSELRDTLFDNWHPLRWVALAAGFFLGMQALESEDGLAAILSVFFLFQAVTNTGCLGSAGCSVPAERTYESNEQEIKETTFTEVNEK